MIKTGRHIEPKSAVFAGAQSESVKKVVMLVPIIKFIAEQPKRYVF